MTSNIDDYYDDHDVPRLEWMYTCICKLCIGLDEELTQKEMIEKHKDDPNAYMPPPMTLWITSHV